MLELCISNKYNLQYIEFFELFFRIIFSNIEKFSEYINVSVKIIVSIFVLRLDKKINVFMLLKFVNLKMTMMFIVFKCEE